MRKIFTRGGGEDRALFSSVLAVIQQEEEQKFLPEVLTTAELGFPAVISSSTRGVMGPKGMPKPILQKLEAAFTEAMKNPGHVEKMETAGLSIKMMVGDNFGKYLQDLYEQCKPLVEEARKSQSLAVRRGDRKSAPRRLFRRQREPGGRRGRRPRENEKPDLRLD